MLHGPLKTYVSEFSVPCQYSLRKYFKRSRKLILTRCKKLKDENKQACDLILPYSEDLGLAHRMKEWF